MPEWSVIHQELKRKGMTRQLLWEEYCRASRQLGQNGFAKKGMVSPLGNVGPHLRASGRRLKHVIIGLKDGDPSESHDWPVSCQLLL